MKNKQQLFFSILIIILILAVAYQLNSRLDKFESNISNKGNVNHFSNQTFQNNTNKTEYFIGKIEGNGNALGDGCTVKNISIECLSLA